MTRTPWNRLAYFGLQSLLQRLAKKRTRRRLRQRDQFTLGPVAAETCEPRQLLSSISAVSPNSGSTSGGTTVTIMGSGFTSVMGIEFGSTMASSYQVLSSSAISAVAPAHFAGMVDIQVMSMMGNSPITTADQFTYSASPPAVTGLSPSSGPAAGGNSVSITGSGFTNVSAILFGSTTASSFNVNSTSSITVMAPAHTAGSVDITIVTSAGTSAVNSSDMYNYTSSAPTISGVSPNTGSGSGGTSVTITGTGFNNVTGVTFGGTNASSYTVNSPTSITASSPAHMAGTVDIIVSAGGGSSATGSSDQFIYTTPVVAPAVTGLGTMAGTTAGGTQVVIMGTNFTNVSGVMFGSMAASSYTVNSPTSITATTPAESAGVVDVRVTNSAGTSSSSAADQFTFQSPAPVVAYLGTTTGSTAGGTPITISGSNFIGATAVYFGTVGASSFMVTSPNSITAYVPAHAAGAVDVTVRNAGGSSATSASDQYTFVTPGALPTVSGLSASSGSSGGGTTLLITGTNFTNVTGVSFGNAAAANYSVQSATSILATAPAGSGTVGVTVTTTSGTSATSSSDQFSYSGSSGSGDTSGTTPVVVGLGTSFGPVAGGTSILILGSGFLGASGVYFGSVPAASYTIVSDSAISAVTPAWTTTAAAVDVTVQSTAGRSTVNAADLFGFGAPGDLPTLTGLDVTSGSTAGGTLVTITGANFDGATGVSFGSVAATQFLVISNDTIIALAPAMANAGTIDITVTTAAATTSTSADDQFTFVAPATSGSTGVSTGSGGAASPPAPAISGLSASSGALAGGDKLTISGTNLSGVTAVMFGSVAARSFIQNSDGTISAKTPASSSPQTVDIQIVTTHGTTVATPADQFTFAAPPPAPTVTGLSTTVGATSGGAVVTISGTNLTQVTGVLFGNQAAASFTVNGDGTITAVARGEPAGIVDVIVTTAGGISSAVAADRFTFSTAVPVVTGLSASSGSASGDELVTISGAHLKDATGVFFGGVAAQSFAINDDGTITAVAPAAGYVSNVPVSVDVTVQNALGTSAPSKADLFTIIAANATPTVSSLSTTTGPTAGGGMVMITGTNFVDVSGVAFGGVASPYFQVLSDTALVARVPAVAQSASLSSPVDVTVTTAAGASASSTADLYTYAAPLATPPVIDSLSAASGYTTGGETVTIYGSGFTGTSAVLFGNIAAASFSVVSDGMVTAVIPAVEYVSNVPVDITVRSAIGTSATGPRDQFTFTPAGALPTVTALSTPSGSTYGGQAFTIIGTNFTDVSGVSFGTTAVTSFTVISSTAISVTAPALVVGTYDITVTTPAGTSAVATADKFASTVSQPTVLGLSAASGFTSGGDTVTIEGTDLSQATAVYFGNTAAASFTINADGSLTAVAPSVNAGASVAITVVTPGGTSATSAATQFTFTPAGATPTVTALDVASGPDTGGQTITITGTNFTDVTGVKFGNIAAASFSVLSPTTLTVVTPSVAQAASLSGPVDVTVTTRAGISAVSTADQFTFQAPTPVVTRLSVKSGFSNGGETVVISGINLAGATAVLFGDTPAAAFTMNANGTITAISPSVAQAASLSGPVDITVITSSGTSPISTADRFTVTPAGALPTVGSLSLNRGPASSGSSGTGDSSDPATIVTITGTNFTDVSGVSFGGIAAQKFVVDSPTRITAFAPQEAAGTVDVAVTTPAGASAQSTADLFTFTSPAPIISGLSVSSGSSSGGDSITIRGDYLSDATAVYFGSVAAASFTANPDGSITVVTPAVAQAASLSVIVDIRVVTPAARTGMTSGDRFTFVPAGAAPTVTGLSTSTGSTAGGQTVVISGTNFSNVSAVKFGDRAATSYFVASPTSIIAISPSSDAGSSYVTVTSAAGSSAGSSNSQYTATASSGTGGSGTGDSSGASNATGTPSGSYVVVPWQGSPMGGSGPTYGTAGWAAEDFLSSDGIPSAPSDPYFNPILTTSTNADPANMSTSWTLTDGGTKLMFLPINMPMPNGSGTETGFISDTLTFTFAASATGNSGSGSGQAHLWMKDVHVEYLKYTAADGTGFTRIDTSTILNDITFSETTTYTGSQINVTANYSALSTGSQSFADHQQGYSSLLSGGRATEDDSGNCYSYAIVSDHYSNGTSNFTEAANATGSDVYSETDTLNSALETDNDTLAGTDQWSNASSATYLKNADGTGSESGSTSQTASGVDMYSNQQTQFVASASLNGPDDVLTMIDVITSSDVGADHYATSSSTNTSTDANGIVTTTASHDDSDFGREQVQTADSGLVDEFVTNADGSTIDATDTFYDSSDDTSTYSDSDDESPVPGGSEDDELASTDDEKDSFSSGDTSKIIVTSVAPAGAVTTVTLSGTSSDRGTAQAHDDIEDDEILSSTGADLADKATFDDSASEEDTETDEARIDITEIGQLTANDKIDLSETLTRAGKIKTTESVDDPGSENDTAGSDEESDDLTEDSDVNVDLRLTDKLHSVEKTTGVGGTETEVDIDSDMLDSMHSEQKDALDDEHTDDSGDPLPSTDDETFDDEETDSESIQGTDEVVVSTLAPITLTAGVGEIIGTGTLFTSNMVADDYTASDGHNSEDAGEDISRTPDAVTAGGLVAGGTVVGGTGTEHDTDTESSTYQDSGKQFVSSTSNENLVDPSTGVRTSIQTTDFVLDKFKDSDNSQGTDEHSEGSGSGDTSGDNVTGEDTLKTEDATFNYDDANIAINGSPSPGSTENISETISLSGTGEDDFQETDEGQDVVGYVSNVPGSGGSSSSSGGSSGSSFHETDDETSDVVESTTSQETINTSTNNRITSIDPTTGLATVETLIASGKLTIGDDVTDQSEDDYTYGEPTDPPNAGQDEITDNSGEDQTLNGSESSTETIAVTGTTPDGTTVNSTETVTSKITASADVEDDKNTTAEEKDVNGQQTRESSQTVDENSDNAEATDTETESVQSSISMTDPDTGLHVAFALQESSKNTTTDTDNGSGTDTQTTSSGTPTSGIGSTVTTTDVFSDEDDFTETGESSNHLKLIQTTSGTDSQGNQVNLQNSASLDDSENIDSFNDDSESADGTNTDTSQEDETTNVQITAFTGGTIVTTDPVTGIKTTIVLNDLIAGTAQDEQADSGNSITPVNGNPTDTESESESGSETSSFSIQDTISQSNPDGSPIGPSTTYGGSGSDTETEVNGVWTDQGNANPVPVAVVGGALPSVSTVVAAGDTTAQGDTAGGDVVIVTGANFTSDSQVAFDGAAAQSSIVISQSEIIGVAPAHAAASVHVTVANAAGTSAPSTADSYNYAPRNSDGSPPPGGNNGGNGGNGSNTGGTGSTNGGSSVQQPITGEQKYQIQLRIGALMQYIITQAKDYKSTTDPGKRQDIMQKIVSAATQAYQLSGQIGQYLDVNRVIDMHLNGLGDEARSWSLAQRYYEALKYGYEHGQFGDEVKGQIGQLLDVLQNPQALAEFAAMMALGFAVKRGVCAAGKGSFVGPLASVALGAGEVAALSIKIASLNQQLNSITFKSEVADYAPQVVEFTVDMVKDHMFLSWIKKFVCFPAGTPVVVGREGDRLVTRPIETLRPGDKVLAREEFGSSVGLCPIVAVSVRKAGSLLHVRFRGADEQIHTITCTPGHPFWVAERAGYVSADELLPGDNLTGPDGERLTFVSCERQDLPDTILVYNFEVAEAHTYFVTPLGGDATAVLVHNGALDCKGSSSGSTNLNSNNAVGNFGVYELHVSGDLHKVGKVHLDRKTKSSGLPTRIHQQVRKLEETHGVGTVEPKIVKKMPRSTTAKAKAAETARLQKIYDRTGKVPDGNKDSFKPE